jgi:hypothetical protein
MAPAAPIRSSKKRAHAAALALLPFRPMPKWPKPTERMKQNTFFFYATMSGIIAIKGVEVFAGDYVVEKSSSTVYQVSGHGRHGGTVDLWDGDAFRIVELFASKLRLATDDERRAAFQRAASNYQAIVGVTNNNGTAVQAIRDLVCEKHYLQARLADAKKENAAFVADTKRKIVNVADALDKVREELPGQLMEAVRVALEPKKNSSTATTEHNVKKAKLSSE